MVKKLMLIGLLVPLLVMPFADKANAACDPFWLLFFGICIQTPPDVEGGSVIVSSKILKIRGDAEESKPSYETALTVEEVKWHWRNKKGNSVNPGNHVFGDQTGGPTVVSVNPALQIRKNGSARDFVEFTNDDIRDLLEAAGFVFEKPNNSKHFWLEFIVTKGSVLNTAFACAVPDDNEPDGFRQIGDPADPRNTDNVWEGACIVQDAIGQTITAPADAEIGVPFDYNQQIDCLAGELANDCMDVQYCPEEGYEMLEDPEYPGGYRCLPSPPS